MPSVDRIDLAADWLARGHEIADQGSGLSAAESLGRRAIKILRKEPHWSNRPAARELVADGYLLLGRISWARGQLSIAEEFLRAALDLYLSNANETRGSGASRILGTLNHLSLSAIKDFDIHPDASHATSMRAAVGSQHEYFASGIGNYNRVAEYLEIAQRWSDFLRRSDSDQAALHFLEASRFRLLAGEVWEHNLSHRLMHLAELQARSGRTDDAEQNLYRARGLAITASEPSLWYRWLLTTSTLRASLEDQDGARAAKDEAAALLRFEIGTE